MPKIKVRRASDNSAVLAFLNRKFVELPLGSTKVPPHFIDAWKLLVPAAEALKPKVDRARRLSVRPGDFDPLTFDAVEDLVSDKPRKPVKVVPIEKQLGLKIGSVFQMHGIKYLTLGVTPTGSLHAFSEHGNMLKIERKHMRIYRDLGVLKPLDAKAPPTELFFK